MRRHHSKNFAPFSLRACCNIIYWLLVMACHYQLRASIHPGAIPNFRFRSLSRASYPSPAFGTTSRSVSRGSDCQVLIDGALSECGRCHFGLEHTCGQKTLRDMAFRIGNFRALIERLGPVFLCEPKPKGLFQGYRTRIIKATLGGRPYIRRSVEYGTRVGRGQSYI
jgi:hypothetical protein